MFTLIGLGVGVAYFYSLVAALFGFGTGVAIKGVFTTILKCGMNKV